MKVLTTLPYREHVSFISSFVLHGHAAESYILLILVQKQMTCRFLTLQPPSILAYGNLIFYVELVFAQKMN